MCVFSINSVYTKYFHNVSINWSLPSAQPHSTSSRNMTFTILIRLQFLIIIHWPDPCTFEPLYHGSWHSKFFLKANLCSSFLYLQFVILITEIMYNVMITRIIQISNLLIRTLIILYLQFVILITSSNKRKNEQAHIPNAPLFPWKMHIYTLCSS